VVAEPDSVPRFAPSIRLPQSPCSPRMFHGFGMVPNRFLRWCPVLRLLSAAGNWALTSAIMQGPHTTFSLVLLRLSSLCTAISCDCSEFHEAVVIITRAKRCDCTVQDRRFSRNLKAFRPVHVRSWCALALGYHASLNAPFWTVPFPGILYGGPLHAPPDDSRSPLLLSLWPVSHASPWLRRPKSPSCLVSPRRWQASRVHTK
jgi:hypothetical protein